MTKLSVSPDEVAGFYDKEWAEYEAKGLSKPNSRHRTILKNLKKAGLKPASTVLEIGCGIGSLSGLIINYLSNGFFAGADISPQTIEFLKKKYSSPGKTDFVVTDMTNFSYAKKFDFIFIDGAFRMTREFFDLSLPLLTQSGLIILDDAIKYRAKMDGFHEYLEER